MQTFEYINLIQDLGTTSAGAIFAIIGLAIMCLFAISVAWKMFMGICRGANRQLVKTATVLIAGILALIATKILVKAFVSFSGTTDFIKALFNVLSLPLDSLVNTFELFEALPTELVQYILAIPTTVLVAPILFIVFYGVAKFILFIIRSIVLPKSKIPKPETATERLSGACLGVVEAIVTFSIFLLPFSSVLNFTDEVYETVISSEEATASVGDESIAELKEYYGGMVKPAISENPVMLLANKTADAIVIDSISQISITDGADNDMRAELMNIIEIAMIDVPKLKTVDFKNLDGEDKEILTAFIDKVSEPGAVSTFISGVISAVATSVDLQDIGIDIDPPLDAVVKDVMSILSTCNVNTLKNDLYLIKDIYFLLSDEQILANINSGDNLLDALTNKDAGEEKNAVQKLIALINDNERTKPLITTLTKLSITMLTSQLGNSDFVAEDTYENLKSTMNEVLAVERTDFTTEEEYKEVLTETLDSNLKENGIELEKEIVSNIADYVDQNYSDKSDLTDEEFNDIILSYYDAYLSYTQNGTVPDDILPPGTNVEDILGGGDKVQEDNEGSLPGGNMSDKDPSSDNMENSDKENSFDTNSGNNFDFIVVPRRNEK